MHLYAQAFYYARLFLSWASYQFSILCLTSLHAQTFHYCDSSLRDQSGNSSDPGIPNGSCNPFKCLPSETDESLFESSYLLKTKSNQTWGHRDNAHNWRVSDSICCRSFKWQLGDFSARGVHLLRAREKCWSNHTEGSHRVL